MQEGQAVTQAWGRLANGTEWFESRLQAEAAPRTRHWVLLTEWCGMSPSGASPACCACSQGACSGASPAQLLLVAAVSLVIWEQLKVPAASDCRRHAGSLSFPLPFPCPIATALASQPGSPCCPRDMPPFRMLCEVCSRFLSICCSRYSF